MSKKMNIGRIARGVTVMLAAAAALPAMASDGEITFNGKVVSTTCSITGGGGANGGKDMTVKLPSVSMSALSSTGEVAGRTPFSIQLSGCTGDSTAVMTNFEMGDTVDSASGRLNLVSGGDADTVAQNVQINVLNESQEQIKVGQPGTTQNSQVVALKDGGATLNYYAEYYATAAATAGSANTRVRYTLDYQ
ncbi:type 1 fimbrial protein [Burkholderia multivorans]|uniref:Pilus assembly protein FimA n=1 Tax=Burkholderia pseudomultivorans TaxID=1207504 RepID=A0A132ETY5_9BURK|nr:MULTISPECIES: fimbrial protein [Burkholderia cepacia complex]KVG64514.1 pilus assembly protein FimA [Burkholderia pseudomultivorans]KWF59696.1 pilus assembly protein FimA [Burkholderia pseudomultivorans]KWI50654.1 pilus assembly protein FimA [Burkholderia pseudomultivorans]MBF5013155.1 type 1 fimbrial protein [Burkholderia pseudomultivorans]MBJ9938854.1 type 1 fimbrial protein [Burkholderia multivorans]